VASVGGVPNASGQHIISVISANTFDLVGSTWGGAYTSGGICLRYFAGGLFQTVAIGNSFADYKLRMFADGSLKIHDATIVLDSANGAITLDPTDPSITVADAGGNTWATLEILTEASQSITAATNASPSVVTINGHGYVNGDTVVVAGATGNTAINGYRIVQGITANTFTLTDMDGVAINGNGVYAGGGTATRYYGGGLFQTIAIGESFANYKLRAFADGSLKILNAEMTLTSVSGTTTKTIVIDPDPVGITVQSVDTVIGGLRTELEDGTITFTSLDTSGAVDFVIGGYMQAGYYQSVSVLSSVATSRMVELYGFTGATVYGPLLALRQARGSFLVPTATQSGDTLGGVVGYGNDGAAETNYAAGLRAVASEIHAGAAHGAELVLEVTPNGATSPVTAVTIDGLGVEIADTLGIGTPPVSQRGIDFGGTITAVANEARGIRVGNSLTLAASADSDLLAGILVNPVFDAGAFAGVTKYGIYASTTEPNYFAGDLILGAKATTYNNAVTEGIGAVPVYASVALTNQSASIGATNLQVGGAVAPVGQYRVSWHTATRTAGAGSVLVTLGWNDGISAKTITGTINLTAGAFQTIITPIIHADGTNNITYATTYAATGAYDIYVTLERLA
jgi:hypothetical protein